MVPNNTLDVSDVIRHSGIVRVIVEQEGLVAAPAIRQRVRHQVLLALGRFCASVRSVTVRIEATSDARGPVRCTVRMALEAGANVEAQVFETGVDTSFQRAIQRAARAAARRIEEGKR